MKGIIVKTYGSLVYVSTEQGDILECKVKGSLRIGNLETSNPVAIGDIVECTVNETGNESIISKIYDRKNHIIRKSSNWSKQIQILAANIDQVILLCSIREPSTSTGFIDRFLIAAESYRIPVILVFNKSDLYSNSDVEKFKQLSDIYTAIGYQVELISSTNHINIEKFSQMLVNKTTLISGNSGVGKSTLINALGIQGNAKTASISGYHKTGKHTTSYSEMYKLKLGGFVIDSPGIKGFGLVKIEKNEIFHFFPEFLKISSSCKYYNCLHLQEPGCAFPDAIDNGLIAKSRYESYLNIYFDEFEKYR